MSKRPALAAATKVAMAKIVDVALETRPKKSRGTITSAAAGYVDIINQLTPASLIIFWIFITMLAYLFVLTVVILHLSVEVRLICYSKYSPTPGFVPNNPTQANNAINTNNSQEKPNTENENPVNNNKVDPNSGIDSNDNNSTADSKANNNDPKTNPNVAYTRSVSIKKLNNVLANCECKCSDVPIKNNDKYKTSIRKPILRRRKFRKGSRKTNKSFKIEDRSNKFDNNSLYQHKLLGRRRPFFDNVSIIKPVINPPQISNNSFYIDNQQKQLLNNSETMIDISQQKLKLHSEDLKVNANQEMKVITKQELKKETDLTTSISITQAVDVKTVAQTQKTSISMENVPKEIEG